LSPLLPAADAGPVTDASGSLVLSADSAIVTADKPALLSLHYPDQKLQPLVQLELTVTPTVVHHEDSFLMVVSKAMNGKPVGGELGSFSFYPAPTKNHEQKFLITVPEATTWERPHDKAKAELAVTLVPIDPAKHPESEFRIVSARFVEP
jgi:hypothetical protein